MSQNQNFKGILIECDYRPCLIPAICWELIKEFLQGFLGSHAPCSIPAYFSQTIPQAVSNQHFQRINEIYQPIDTIQQYLDHFNNYRKQSWRIFNIDQHNVSALYLWIKIKHKKNLINTFFYCLFFCFLIKRRLTFSQLHISFFKDQSVQFWILFSFSFRYFD